jgi:hypothetical protein
MRRTQRRGRKAAFRGDGGHMPPLAAAAAPSNRPCEGTLPRRAAFANANGLAELELALPTSTARTHKGQRRLRKRSDRRSVSPHWQFLRGFLKHPVMVGSIIPSSRVLIERVLKPVDWKNTKLFVEYGPGSAPSPGRSSRRWARMPS